MSETYTDREPVTRREHRYPWVADLAGDAHATDPQLIVGEAVDAVEQTPPGQFVSLVTHERHGHPSSYLYDALRSFDGRVELSDGSHCSCGAYVTRVCLDEEK